mgnify:CR=1 FL=1
MRRITPFMFLAASLFAGAPLAAAAEQADTSVGQDAPLSHPGFGALKWGAPIKAVYAVYPALKKTYRPAEVVKALRAGRGVVLSVPVMFRDQKFTARLRVDPDGLHRVDLTREISSAPGAPTADKVLDPIIGTLPAPDEQPNRKVWKGATTVLVLTTEALAASTRLELAFIDAAAYRPEEAGGSLTIE